MPQSIELFRVCLGRLAAAVCMVAAAPVVWGAQCDCQQVLGQCTGAVEVTKTFGNAPSYGAEIAVYSSEKVCSKVEFYVDSTPYQTVLVNRNKDTENVFGTSPVKNGSVRYIACFVCKNLEGPGSTQAAKQATETPPFHGSWSGYTTSLFGRQDGGFQISVADGKIGGTYQHPKMGTLNLYDAAYADGVLRVKCDSKDGPVQFVLTVNADAMRGTWSAGIFSGQVEMTRR
ncbi:hypothetical protein M8A51_08495 [Schlegelella sp. S2-27]|uniref:Lipoprotein n=1 Tax=Caldimonas mangrovi TaxID=2944811 RepID=A0ABT0YLH0_9BURK|nr:hypothetical protein [Caldimonas mangrovi]MCM5679570.1 hypothetical protein [Caldimonas mangrovi]